MSNIQIDTILEMTKDEINLSCSNLEKHINCNKVRKLLDELDPPKVVEQKIEKLIPLKRLECYTLDFGKYAGENFCNIPFQYLEWLVGSMESTLKQLKSYLKHPELKREDEDEIDEDDLI